MSKNVESCNHRMYGLCWCWSIIMLADLGTFLSYFWMPLSLTCGSKVVTNKGIREEVDGIVAVTLGFFGNKISDQSLFGVVMLYYGL